MGESLKNGGGGECERPFISVTVQQYFYFDVIARVELRGENIPHCLSLLNYGKFWEHPSSV